MLPSCRGWSVCVGLTLQASVVEIGIHYLGTDLIQRYVRAVPASQNPFINTRVFKTQARLTQTYVFVPTSMKYIDFLHFEQKQTAM